jgi:hypothetical protein
MTRLRGIYMPYEHVTVGSPWPRSIQRLRDAGSTGNTASLRVYQCRLVNFGECIHAFPLGDTRGFCGNPPGFRAAFRRPGPRPPPNHPHHPGIAGPQTAGRRSRVARAGPAGLRTGQSSPVPPSVMSTVGSVSMTQRSRRSRRVPVPCR